LLKALPKIQSVNGNRINVTINVNVLKRKPPLQLGLYTHIYETKNTDGKYILLYFRMKIIPCLVHFAKDVEDWFVN